MANSDIVVPSRELMYVGDVAYQRSVSESLLGRFAATNNFISKFQTDYIAYFLNGSYSFAAGSFGFDGAYTCFTKMEIVGVAAWNAISGVSGTTTFDIKYIDVNNIDQGSIFSTKPSIDSTSSNATRGFRNLETGNDFTMTGVTLPVLSKTTFEEGETLYFELSDAMLSAQNCSLQLNIRPTT